MLHDAYPVKSFKNAAAFETWLSKNHNKENGLWLKIAKANTGIPTVTHLQALDVALCYGWIDGIRRGLDEQYFIQKFTPRRANSQWSVINRNRVAQLIEQGRMKEQGLAAIDTAKKNGQWDKAYASQSTIEVPEDLQLLLNKNRKANAFFKKLSSQNRYSILYRLHSVKREETRKRKLLEFVKMLERHETIYPQ